MSSIYEPIVFGGDLNIITDISERKGGSGRLSKECLLFRQWLEDNQLVDLGFIGSQFTWRRGTEAENHVSKRLDRVCMSPLGREQWPEASVKHLPRLSSDHNPLLVSFDGFWKGDPKRRPFRFQSTWMTHPEFRDLLSSSWNKDAALPEALEQIQPVLKK